MLPPDGIPIYIGGRTQSPSPDGEDNASYAIAGLVVAAFLLWAAYQGVRYLGTAVSYLSKHIPDTVPHSAVYLTAGILAVITGRVLFHLRESKRAAYAYLELGSAFGAAVEACTRYGIDTVKPELLFTIMGAIYISVRGFDNLQKASEERRVKVT